MAKIVLVERRPLLVAGLSSFLTQGGGHVVWIWAGKDDLKELLHTTNPHIIIADPDDRGFITRREIEIVKRTFPRISILLLTEPSNLPSPELLQSVDGLITKDCDQDELLRAVGALSSGQRYFSQHVLNIIVQTSWSAPKDKRDPSQLTSREAELLILIAKGYSNIKAADYMNLSPHTVHTHRKKIIKKLNIKSPTEFIVHALDLGLMELPVKN